MLPFDDVSMQYAIHIYTLKSKQNGGNFIDDIWKSPFFSDRCTLIEMSVTKAIVWTKGCIACRHELTQWGRVTHICVVDLTIIGSDNGLSPCRRQAIIWTNAGILLIGPLGTNFSEMLIEIHIFSFKKIHLKMSSLKWRPFCLGLNQLTHETEWIYPHRVVKIFKHAIRLKFCLLI